MMTLLIKRARKNFLQRTVLDLENPAMKNARAPIKLMAAMAIMAVLAE